MGNKTRFHSLLEERVNDRAQGRAASLATGVAGDYAQYQRNVGYIEGLNDALAIANDIARESE